MKKTISLLAVLTLLACTESPKKKSNQWITLFDGTSLEGWRAYNGDQMPPGWKIVDSSYPGIHVASTIALKAMI